MTEEMYKKLNEQLLNNCGIECMKTIGLDLNNDEETINKLTESMRYIEDKVCRGKVK